MGTRKYFLLFSVLWVVAGCGQRTGIDSEVIIPDAKTLVADSYLNSNPAWSPDGSRILYTALRTGSDLWEYSLSTGRLTRLTHELGRLGDLNPAVSPAGDKVAVTIDDGLAILNLPDNHLAPLVSNGSSKVISTDPDWSPDGGWIAYAKGKEQELDLWLVSPVTREEKTVLRGFGSVVEPRWSPDGKRIAFTSRINQNSRVVILNLDDTTTAIVSTAEAEAFSPSWSLDGTRLAFVVIGMDECKIRIANLTGGREFRDLSPGFQNVSDLSWSPDGNSIMFEAEGGIWIIPIDGGQPQWLVSNGGGRAVWFASEDKILLERKNNTSLWTVPITGGQKEPFIQEENWEQDASWSPDGQEVAFSSGRSGAFDIWVTSLSEGTWQQITSDAAADRHPDWSPDGKEIVFSSDGRLVVVSRHGNGRRVLTTEDVWADEPSWSPDGQSIVFTAQVAGSKKLMKIPATGGTAVPLDDGIGQGEDPHWAPMGTKVYNQFGPQISYENAMGIWLFSVREREKSLVVSGGQDACWSPDGTQIVYSSNGKILVTPVWILFDDK